MEIEMEIEMVQFGMLKAQDLSHLHPNGTGADDAVGEVEDGSG